MANTLSGPFAAINVANGSTPANATWGNNAQTQAAVALGSLNPDLVGAGFILSGCAATRHNSYAATVLADSPVHYHRLDESSGTVAFDSSGNNIPLSYFASPTLNVVGLLTGDSDTCVTFAAASSQYAAGTSSAGLPTGAGAVTLECWMKFAANPASTQILVEIGDQSVATHRLALNILNTGAMQMSNGTTAVTSAALTTNTRHHIVGTYDGTNLRLYVDGALAAGPTAATMALSYTGNAVAIAATSGATPGTFYSGQIDEVAIYATALSSGQVTTHYTNGTTATTQVDIASGVAYVQVSDGTLARCTVTSATQTTSALSSTYHLYLQPDGTWYWSTSNSPAANSLAIANVATDGSGNAITVTDLRSFSISLLPNATGALNTPRVVAQTGASGVSVTSTADTTILSYTPPAAGWYRVSLQFSYVNPTPQKVSANVHWMASDAGAYATNYFVDNLGGSLLNGSQAASTGNNQEVTCTPITLRSRAGAAFGVHFQDGGGTPADTVHVFIERLS